MIANRGEIARRVIRTAARMGIRTIAVHSDADTQLPYVREADHAVYLGPAPPASSYLDADRLMAAALASGAQAVHPGYGFLAENAQFAAAGHRGRPDLDRAAAGRDRADGRQDQRPEPDGKGGRAGGGTAAASRSWTWRRRSRRRTGSAIR